MSNFADRMKMYEKIKAGDVLIPRLPICVRLDGRSFSKLTKKLDRPYDKRLSDLMIEVTKYLVQESGAVIGYTQSDEITLILNQDGYNSEPFFGGKVQKLCSVLASAATVKFASESLVNFDNLIGALPQFDCRVWNVPSKEEACNVLLWRELDATRNSISMAAQAVFSHKELHGKNTSEMQEMLFQKGVNWNDYPEFFKRGSYVQRRVIERKMTPFELANIPKDHRPDPGQMVTRTEYHRIDMPQFSSVGNRVQVVFEGDMPLCHCADDENHHSLIQDLLGGKP